MKLIWVLLLLCGSVVAQESNSPVKITDTALEFNISLDKGEYAGSTFSLYVDVVSPTRCSLMELLVNGAVVYALPCDQSPAFYATKWDHIRVYSCTHALLKAAVGTGVAITPGIIGVACSETAETGITTSTMPQKARGSTPSSGIRN